MYCPAAKHLGESGNMRRHCLLDPDHGECCLLQRAHLCPVQLQLDKREGGPA